jgi:hypothetical protein
MSKNVLDFKARANELADAIIRTADTKVNGRIVKLPPSLSREAQGRNNLVAVIKLLADYESGDKDTLNGLTQRFAEYGGRPILAEDQFRKLHNWLRQVSYAIRMAIVDSEYRRAVRNGGDLKLASKRVHDLLYSDPKRVFVATPVDSPHQYKPLRYATTKNKLRWIEQEMYQREMIAQGKPVRLGARLSDEEWAASGMSGQYEHTMLPIQKRIEELIRTAEKLDSEGRYHQADEVDAILEHLFLGIQMSDSNGNQ